VEAAVDLLAGLPRRGGRVAVFGTMRELGHGSAAIHRESAESIVRRDLDRIVATGEFAAAFEPLAADLGDRLIIDEDPIQAFDRLSPFLRGDEVVLLKASRGVALERLLPRFEEKWGPLHPHGEAFGPRASSRGTGERGDAPSAERPLTDVRAPGGDGDPASGTMGG
jgi:plasmid stability protein